MKTNKSFSKRVKVTKSGKLLVRKPGQNHFNAKEDRASQLNGKRSSTFTVTPKSRSRFMPGK